MATEVDRLTTFSLVSCADAPWTRRFLTRKNCAAVSEPDVRPSFLFSEPLAAYDEALNAFMTLPPYSSTSEGEATQLGRGPKRSRLDLRMG